MFSRIRSLALAGLTLVPFGCAQAQGTGQPEASPEMLQAALQVALAQRDQALNEGIRQGAQITLAQREIARLRQELDAARKAPPSASKPPVETK